MTNSDFRRFSWMLALISEQYGKSISPELTRFYFDALEHIDLAAIREALNRHVRNTDTGQFMPKVADIIRALTGTTQDAAYGALVELQAAFGAVGAYESPTFADPVLASVVADMGGWPEVCSRNSEEWQKFGSVEFMRRYRSLASRGAAPDMPRLAGIFDRTNVALGYQISLPAATQPKQIESNERKTT